MDRNSRTFVSPFRPLAWFVLCLSLCAGAAAQTPQPGIKPVKPSPRPIPHGGGGQYHGPGDIVPPSLPPFDPNDPSNCEPQLVASCNPATLPTTQCGAACPSLPMVEQGGGQCIHCQGDPDGSDGLCFAAKGWSLTFGKARAFCQEPDPSCLDASHNVTVCATHPNACEVHLFESSWINHDLFPNRPVCAPVAVQACIDGNPLFSQPHALDSQHQGLSRCGQHTVCLTFNKDCFCNAVLGWESLLGGSASYDNQYLFHIGFTTCQTCPCPDLEP